MGEIAVKYDPNEVALIPILLKAETLAKLDAYRQIIESRTPLKEITIPELIIAIIDLTLKDELEEVEK